MFLVAHTIDPSDALNNAKVDVRKLAQESRITTPTYSGTTSSGAEINITATNAQPDPDDPQRISARDVVGTLKTKAGTSAKVRATRGIIDSPKNLLTLIGDVHMDSSNDLHLRSLLAVADLSKNHLTASGGVTFSAPDTTITARNMDLHADPAHPGSYVVVFNTNVKLVYRPRN
ncbi:hypothetical protein FGG78_29645 [Thioclava sp. BHET1]|nr:hypothetical protein FGG78_29645 [Thioclava sp. BHET1]